MNRLPKLLLPLLALAVPWCASAQVYKWTDAQGTVHYSDSPPPQGTHYDRLRMHGTTAVAAPPADPTKAADRAEAATPTPTSNGTTAMADTPKNREAFCAQTKQNIALLSGDQKLSIHGAGGKLTQLSDQQRRQQLATARHDYEQRCQP